MDGKGSLGDETMMVQEHAYLTADFPGIGGVIKQRPEDFLVEEIPLYESAGKGEHLSLLIEKRLRSTSDVIRRLATAFRVSKADVGYAGLKDKRAVTRQYFSVRMAQAGQADTLLNRIDDDHIKLLRATRHDKKLRRGDLAGNRFVIWIRQVDPGAALQARRILDFLVRSGCPNFFGHQRFGYRLVNHKLGRLLLLGKWQEMLDLMLGHPLESDHPPTRAARKAYECGDYAGALDTLPRHLRHDRQAIDMLRQGKNAQEAVMAIDRQQRAFLISAVQSAIFNRVLDRRLRDPTGPGIHRLIEGDLAWRHSDRTVFAVEHMSVAQENTVAGQMQTLAICPSGPMWGVGMPKAGREVGKWERQALADEQLLESDLHGGPQGTARGDRRPMRTKARDAVVSGGVDEHGSYVQVAFQLPRGSFATVVLRELMKTLPRAATAQDRCLPGWVAP